MERASETQADRAELFPTIPKLALRQGLLRVRQGWYLNVVHVSNYSEISPSVGINGQGQTSENINGQFPTIPKLALR